MLQLTRVIAVLMDKTEPRTTNGIAKVPVTGSAVPRPSVVDAAAIVVLSRGLGVLVCQSQLLGRKYEICTGRRDGGGNEG